MSLDNKSYKVCHDLIWLARNQATRRSISRRSSPVYLKPFIQGASQKPGLFGGAGVAMAAAPGNHHGRSPVAMGLDRKQEMVQIPNVAGSLKVAVAVLCDALPPRFENEGFGNGMVHVDAFQCLRHFRRRLPHVDGHGRHLLASRQRKVCRGRAHALDHFGLAPLKEFVPLGKVQVDCVAHVGLPLVAEGDWDALFVHLVEDVPHAVGLCTDKHREELPPGRIVVGARTVLTAAPPFVAGLSACPAPLVRAGRRAHASHHRGPLWRRRCTPGLFDRGLGARCWVAVVAGGQRQRQADGILLVLLVLRLLFHHGRHVSLRGMAELGAGFCCCVGGGWGLCAGLFGALPQFETSRMCNRGEDPKAEFLCMCKRGGSRILASCVQFRSRILAFVCNQPQRPPEKPWIAASHHSLTLPRNHTPLSPVAKSLGVCTQARIVVDDRTTRRNSLLNSVSVISVIIHSKKNKLNQSGR